MRPPTTWLNPKIEVTRSPIHGKGMFARSLVEKGEVIVRWGDGYTDQKGAEDARRQGRGTMQWDDEIFSVELSPDEDPSDGDLYAINHSCDSNTWMAGAFTLCARRTIMTGEEITTDCALFEANEAYFSEWKCKCGFSFCRGRVTGHDWRDPELQRRYRDHFSPLINKRIERATSGNL